MKNFICVGLFLVMVMVFSRPTVSVTGKETIGTESQLSLEIIHEIHIDLAIFVRQGDYFYASDHSNLYIIDAQDEAYPAVVGTLPLSVGFSLAVSGNYVYVETGLRTITIVDVSTPETPFIVTSYSDFEAEYGVLPFIFDIAAAENTLYVALYYIDNACPEGGKVAILDVTDPAKPVRIGEGGHTVQGSADIEIKDGYLYQNNTEHVFIYDVSVPGVMDWVNVIALDRGMHHHFGSMVLDDDLLLLTFSQGGYPCGVGGDEGWFVLDISNPLDPNENFLVFQPDEFGITSAYEDGYIFSIQQSGTFQVLTIPEIETVVFEGPPILRNPMHFSSGILSFLPKDEQAFTTKFTTGRLSASSTTLSPTITGTLTYTDVHGMTEVLFPAGSVDHPAEVSILPLPAPDNPPADRWLVQAFDIRGHYPAQQQTLDRFQQPLTATLPFTPDPVAYPLGWEFLYWTETEWSDAATTCAADVSPPPAVRQAHGEPVQYSFCLPGKYGLFIPVYDLSLPVIHR